MAHFCGSSSQNWYNKEIAPFLGCSGGLQLLNSTFYRKEKKKDELEPIPERVLDLNKVENQELRKSMAKAWGRGK